MRGHSAASLTHYPPPLLRSCTARSCRLKFKSGGAGGGGLKPADRIPVRDGPPRARPLEFIPPRCWKFQGATGPDRPSSLRVLFNVGPGNPRAE